jgi:hypothetical protein
MTLAVEGVADTETGGAVMVTVAAALLVESAALVAVIVTVPGLGMADGAVYRPDVEIVPTCEEPPVIPLTLQTTAVFDVFETAAVNCWF